MVKFEITHIQEPKRLSIGWIPSLSNGPENRTWRRVAEIRRSENGQSPILTYLVDTGDFKEAKQQGFTGFPAFPLTSVQHSQNVMETLLKRLPPRSRGDFPQYLDMFRIPREAALSDFALLGYTEARLPSDGFAILLHLEDFIPPFEVVLDVAGFRHESNRSSAQLSVGEPLFLRPAPHPKDEYAIEVWSDDNKLGYVPRLHARSLCELVKQNRTSAFIERLNGSPDRPIVRLFLTVS